MKRSLCFLFLLLLVPQMAEAAKKKPPVPVAFDLTENFIGVDQGFDGSRMTVFGVMKNKADLVIVIEGPEAQAKVRKKTKQFGIWVNGEPETLEKVPSYYAVVSSRPIEQIAPVDTLDSYGLNVDHLPFSQTEFGKGLVSVKQDEGLYRYAPDGIKVLESNLFRADFFLPSSVPIGHFHAHIYEFVDGKVSSSREEGFDVAQVGLNAKLNEMSHQNALSYSLVALLLSLGIGWGAAYLFRKRS